jgi:hypothetical protein
MAVTTFRWLVLAGRGAAVEILSVAIVTLFTCLNMAVTTFSRLVLAGRGAFISVILTVAVVTLFIALNSPVTTSLYGAKR